LIPEVKTEPAPWPVHVALIFVQISFAAFYVVSKRVLSSVDPLVVAGLRILIATPVLLVFARIHNRSLPARSDLPLFAIMGFLGIFANQALYIIGIDHTTATSAGVLMPAIPVFTVAIAAMSGVEAISWRKIVGIASCITGAWSMLDLSSLSFDGGASFGNLLILLNGLSYALFLVLQRRILGRYPPLTVIAWSFVFGSLFVSFVSLPSMIRADYQSIPAGAMAGLGYMIVVATILNYFLNTWAVSRSSTSLVASYIMLQPVASAVLAGLFLGETIGIRESAGTLFILAGLAVVSRNGEKKTRQTTAGSMVRK